MDFRKIYAHSVLYPRNKMAFKTPSAPRGLHFFSAPRELRISQSKKSSYE